MINGRIESIVNQAIGKHIVKHYTIVIEDNLKLNFTHELLLKLVLIWNIETKSFVKVKKPLYTFYYPMFNDGILEYLEIFIHPLDAQKIIDLLIEKSKQTPLSNVLENLDFVIFPSEQLFG